MKGALLMNGDENSGSIQIINSDEHTDQHLFQHEIDTVEKITTENNDNCTNTAINDATSDNNSDNSYSQNSVIFYF